MRGVRVWFGIAGMMLLAAPAIRSADVTEQDAVRVAKDLLAGVGRPVPPGQAAVKAEIRHNRGVWKVEFLPSLEIEVSRATGKAVGFLDHSAIPTTAPASPITGQQAREEAEQQISALRLLPEDAVFQRVNPLILGGILGDPATGPAIWQVIWTRNCGPYPVVHDTFVVQVDAGTGRLIGFGNNFRTPCPAVLQPAITHDSALEAARRAAGTMAGERSPARLVIVDPDFEGSVRDYGNRSILGYLIMLDDGSNVVVDAQTSQVVSVSGLARRIESPERPREPGLGACPNLPALLQKADALRVVQYDAASRGARKVATVPLSAGLRTRLTRLIPEPAVVSQSRSAEPGAGRRIGLTLMSNGKPLLVLMLTLPDSAVSGRQRPMLWHDTRAPTNRWCGWQTTDKLTNLLESLLTKAPGRTSTSSR